MDAEKQIGFFDDTGVGAITLARPSWLLKRAGVDARREEERKVSRRHAPQYEPFGKIEDVVNWPGQVPMIS